MDEQVRPILEKYQYKKEFLISILQDVQAVHYYLPKEVLEQLSQALQIPISKIYSVATFFKAFSLEPRGRHLINVCVGTACHVRGAVRVMEGIEREIGIGPGETDSDLKFSLEAANCLGCCALGPVMVVDGEYHGKLSTAKAVEVLRGYE
ncbi:MAG: NAD(P)H-dependent oxidoreductase subunit E [Chloroflexi bacterium]|nr:NAD(P)H-dependent oxidoreductase subunit E [Chloroflexota bacterium]